MRDETVRFFEAVVREDLPVTTLVDADFTFLDARLARLYGVERPAGADGLVRVPAPPHRGGLLGQASILTATSNPTRTSPVKRGRWVLEVLLDDPPGPPLPGLDSLRDQEVAQGKTLRERLELHRADPRCASCHARMDPLGFGLERFDAIGGWRDQDAGKPIDDEGTLPGGVTFQGADGLRAYLRARPRDLARALARKLLIFAVGRGPIAADDAALDALVDGLAPDYRVGDLVVGITRLDAFQRRRLGRSGR
jgi:hypothetical protein